MAPYPIFFRALKTIIMPNFMLLTESEQFKHISALLFGAETVVKPTLINHDRRYVFIHNTECACMFRVLYYQTNKQLARLLRNLGEVGCG